MKNADSTEKEIQEAAEDFKSHAKLTGAAAMDVGRATYRHLQGKALDSSQKVDRVVRGNPYMAVGLSFCTGLLVGAFLARPKQKPERDDED